MVTTSLNLAENASHSSGSACGVSYRESRRLAVNAMNGDQRFVAWRPSAPEAAGEIA
jgi:hypothetical protein